MSDFMSQVGSLSGHGSNSGGLPMSPTTGPSIWQGTTPTGDPNASSNPFSLSFAPARPALPMPQQAGMQRGGLFNNPMLQQGGSALMSSLMGLL